MMREQVKINTPFIKLDSFLKLAGAADTGGMAKAAVQDGLVTVDGEVCTMRGKKLTPGAVVEFRGKEYEVASG